MNEKHAHPEPAGTVEPVVDPRKETCSGYKSAEFPKSPPIQTLTAIMLTPSRQTKEEMAIQTQM